MGSSQSAPRHDYNGPLFGGHYAGDFSIRRNRPDLNKPLPPPPPSKSVRCGVDPPAWEFYKNRPTDENLVNTRYCPPPPPTTSSGGTPPPAYGTWDEKGLTVRNP
ncbi:uncharacterized protein L201_003087 [Kwoniella dendrophila CBS 6074]|uniref:Uncharacterized protein n=1 Tax=Kwoniella dendrophila CBS 6074 TaxID=1295534 RepID=A0AAX4JUF3_9TREE